MSDESKTTDKQTQGWVDAISKLPPQSDRNPKEPKPNTKTVARFKVPFHLDGAKWATVEINRSNLMVTVRPLRRQTTYDMLLGDVAEMVAYHVAKTQASLEKPKRRRGVARGMKFGV